MRYARADAKRAALETFRGLWAATTTPFDDEGGCALDALTSDVRRLVDDLEIDGVFCTGVMSEFWALSVAERAAQVATVVAATGDRCPVIAHTGHHSLTETIELTRQAEEAGADFAVVVRPYYPADLDDEGIYDFYAQLCAAVDLGVWVFDTGFAGPALSLDLVSRLADLETICGIKVGHPHAHYLDVLAKVGDRILVCEPNETEWLANMRDHGQRVFMSSAAPYLLQTPGSTPMRDYTRAALAGDFATATTLRDAMEPLRRLSDKWLHGARSRGEHPVPVIKAWAGLLGMAGGPVRPPLRTLGRSTVEALAADLEAVGLR